MGYIMQKLKASIIGLGKQNLKDNIPAIKTIDSIEISSICDINKDILRDVSNNLEVSAYDNINDLLKYDRPDIAFIALPHFYHFDTTKLCLEYEVDVFKEKPLAMNYQEAFLLHNLVEKHNKIFYTTSQRRFSSIFNLAKQKLNKIGNIYSVDMNYTMHVSNLENSWRSNKSMSGGEY